MVYGENEGEVFLGRSITTHKNVSEATMQKVDAEIRRIIDEQYALARKLLEENRDKVEVMTKALLEWETIDADQIDDIMAGQPPRPPKPVAAQARRSRPTAAAPQGAEPRPRRRRAPERRSTASSGAGEFLLPLDRPLVMGVVNVTPDSFSDGGRFLDPQRGHRARRCGCVDEGADIVDVGGESTRPGAQPVAVDEELRRVLPVLEGARRESVPVSVDTTKPEVMRAAIAAGASMINDIERASARPARSRRSRDSRVRRRASCTCRATPATMQQEPRYDDVVAEVGAFLRERVARAARPPASRATASSLDPGLRLRQDRRAQPGAAARAARARGAGLSGPRRRVAQVACSATITGRAGRRARWPAALPRLCSRCRMGRAILRVHDVKETRDALAVWQALDRRRAMSTQIFRHRRRARHASGRARSRRISC